MRIMTPAYAPCAYAPTAEEQTAIANALVNAECVRADDSAEISDGERITVYAYDENEPERLVLTVFPNDLVRVSADGYADHGVIYQFPQEAVEAIRRAAQHDGDDLVNRLTWCREDTIGTPEIWMNFVINPKEYDMCIFNQNGQTGNLTVPGNNYIYDNGTWTVYEDAEQPTTQAPTIQTTTQAPTTVPVTDKVLIGDANQDGKVNVVDATEIQKHIVEMVQLSGKALKAADTNNDGSVNIKDVTAIQYYAVDNKTHSENCGKMM